MDKWKFYGITHRDVTFCNPMSEQKFDELVGLLDLPPDSRALDVACGKAELLRRISRRYGASGVGVDISPYEVKDAVRKNLELGLDRRIEIVEGDGAKHETEPESFDLTMCIGATWVWGGYKGTLSALKQRTRPGGLILVGEPYKIKDPDQAYLDAEGDFAANLVTHHDNYRVGVDSGLTFLYSMVSSADDWDRYEGMTHRGAESYAIENPEDLDVPELLDLARQNTEKYLRWGRDTLGWAVYMFRKPE